MAVAGALERKVWIRAFDRTTYPNLYILLAAGPGVGKTEAIREVQDVWEGLGPTLHTAADSVSRASLVDNLEESERTVVRPEDIKTPVVRFHSLQVLLAEFGTFLSQYETEFMSTLNHLYDGTRYREKKRGNKLSIDLPSPQLSILAGSTPSWLGTNLPESAWSEGFASRLLLVFSAERIKVDPFASRGRDERLKEALVHDLKLIHGMYGQLAWHEDVVAAFREWYMGDCQPIPQHPKLEHYLPRRHIHLLKLCIVYSAARAGDYIIQLEDYQNALDTLLEAEALMPDVFKTMRTTDTNVYDETFQFVWSLYAKDQKPIHEHRIIAFIKDRTPSHSVLNVLQVMLSSGMLDVVLAGANGTRAMYKPGSRQPG